MWLRETLIQVVLALGVAVPVALGRLGPRKLALGSGTLGGAA